MGPVESYKQGPIPPGEKTTYQFISPFNEDQTPFITSIGDAHLLERRYSFFSERKVSGVNLSKFKSSQVRRFLSNTIPENEKAHNLCTCGLHFTKSTII